MSGGYLYWQFIGAPKKIIYISRKTLVYLWHLFSIRFLLKTLFLPWKRDIIRLVNPSIQQRLSQFMGNLVSRFMGVVVRSLTIIAGSLILLLVFVLSILVFILWFLLPFLGLYMIYRGIVT